MIRVIAWALVAGFAIPALGPAPGKADPTGHDAAPTTAATTATTTATGWFSDIDCAGGYLASGNLKPNNPDCVKRCLDKGITPVFVDQDAKAMFAVKDYPTVKDDIGWHIELTGTIDAERKTIAVESVKRLEYIGSTCALPKKKTAPASATAVPAAPAAAAATTPRRR